MKVFKYYFVTSALVLLFATHLITASALEQKFLRGAEITPYIPSIVHLCMKTWQEYPDLYEGTWEEYSPYVTIYSKFENGVAALLLDNNKLVGVAMGLPLLQKGDEFAEPFYHTGLDLTTVFYVGEVVIHKRYRNQGWGTRLYQELARWIEHQGIFTHIALLTTIGEHPHPLRPEDYIPADAFWKKQGFTPYPELQFTKFWRSIETHEETERALMPWIKSIAPEN